MSRCPLVVRSAVAAVFPVRIALSAWVVPWMKNSARPRNSSRGLPLASAAFCTAASTPWIGSCGTVDALVINQVPSLSSTRRSVKVPPVSQARRIELHPLYVEHLPCIRGGGRLSAKIVDDVDGSLHQRGVARGEHAAADVDTVFEPYAHISSEQQRLRNHRPQSRGDTEPAPLCPGGEAVAHGNHRLGRGLRGPRDPQTQLE